MDFCLLRWGFQEFQGVFREGRYALMSGYSQLRMAFDIAQDLFARQGRHCITRALEYVRSASKENAFLP